MEWLRDECSFISWAPTARLLCPASINSSTCSTLVTSNSVRPGTILPCGVCVCHGRRERNGGRKGREARERAAVISSRRIFVGRASTFYLTDVKLFGLVS